MDDFTKLISVIFGGVVLIAIVSVIVSRQSQAPQAIRAISSGIGNVVAAAVQPVTNAINSPTTNFGYGSGASTFSLPTSNTVSEITSAFGDLAPVIPGGSK